jgi:DtxR family Mn-dependent transcriptional regulator
MRKHPKEALEDYLKAIYTLEQKAGSARTTALAAALGVTPGSVTDMLKRLAAGRPRLVIYKPHKGVSLTSKGKAQAIEILRRHRLVETFLYEILGYRWDEVHAEADILEHHVSDHFIQALDDLLNHPASDPHGDPIPTAEGSFAQAPYPSLNTLPVGSAVVVKRVHCHNDELLRYLAQKDIRPGARLRIREIAPAGGPVLVAVMGIRSEPATVALSAEVAADILVSEDACP